MYFLCSFKINYQTRPQDDGDIVFHFRAYLDSVDCDSHTNGKWQNKQRIEDVIFAEGEPYNIFMLFRPAVCDVRSFKKQNERINN